jgi:hypothetical protein
MRAASVIAISLSTMLPLVSIAILYAVSSVPTRLGIITIFTLAFSLCIGFATDAKRGEMFGAAAA